MHTSQHKPLSTGKSIRPSCCWFVFIHKMQHNVSISRAHPPPTICTIGPDVGPSRRNGVKVICQVGRRQQQLHDCNRNLFHNDRRARALILYMRAATCADDDGGGGGRLLARTKPFFSVAATENARTTSSRAIHMFHQCALKSSSSTLVYDVLHTHTHTQCTSR